ncbi:penicillin acylase family protein, partial [bacterium]|nr:penicillin acylase family protein [bacterium]
DDKTTEKEESLSYIVREAFRGAVKNLNEDWGTFSEKWAWGKVRGTDISHLGLIPGFGREDLFTGGNSHVINAIKKSHGPSWRMVVEMGPEVKAWGIYPGGQSGNPGSRYYDNGVKDWVEGEIYELLYLQSPDEKRPGIQGITVLGGER